MIFFAVECLLNANGNILHLSVGATLLVAIGMLYVKDSQLGVLEDNLYFMYSMMEDNEKPDDDTAQ